MSGMMSIDMVHQLHHHDWAQNTLKTSNRTCNDLTSCLYVPCFSVAKTSDFYDFSAETSKVRKFVLQTNPISVPWNLHCHECVFVATGSVKLSQYTSRPLFLPHERLPRYKNVSQPGQASGTLKACCWTLGKWIPSSGEMRNIEKPFGFIWYLLISTIDMRKLVVAIYFLFWWNVLHMVCHLLKSFKKIYCIAPAQQSKHHPLCTVELGLVQACQFHPHKLIGDSSPGWNSGWSLHQEQTLGHRVP